MTTDDKQVHVILENLKLLRDLPLPINVMKKRLGEDLKGAQAERLREEYRNNPYVKYDYVDGVLQTNERIETIIQEDQEYDLEKFSNGDLIQVELVEKCKKYFQYLSYLDVEKASYLIKACFEKINNKSGLSESVKVDILNIFIKASELNAAPVINRQFRPSATIFLEETPITSAIELIFNKYLKSLNSDELEIRHKAQSDFAIELKDALNDKEVKETDRSFNERVELLEGLMKSARKLIKNEDAQKSVGYALVDVFTNAHMYRGRAGFSR